MDSKTRPNALSSFSVSPVATLRVAMVLALAALADLSAQIVAWDVNGQNAASGNPLAATTLDSHLAGASLTLGSGVTASAATNTFGASGFDQTSLAGAISAGDYLSFTLTPAAGGSALNLTSMSFLFGVSTAVTNFNVALASSVSGFGTGDTLWSYGFSTVSPAMQTVALSAVPALQNLTSVVEFRLYGWRDVAGTSTFRIRDNSGSDLSVSVAASAIPEPSAWAAVAGGCGLALAAFRRKAPRWLGAKEEKLE